MAVSGKIPAYKHSSHEVAKFRMHISCGCLHEHLRICTAKEVSDLLPHQRVRFMEHSDVYPEHHGRAQYFLFTLTKMCPSSPDRWTHTRVAPIFGASGSGIGVDDVELPRKLLMALFLAAEFRESRASCPISMVPERRSKNCLRPSLRRWRKFARPATDIWKQQMLP